MKRLFLWGTGLFLLVLGVWQVGAQESDRIAPVVGFGPVPLVDPVTSPTVLPTTPLATEGSLIPRAYLPLVLRPDVCLLSTEAGVIADLASAHPNQQRPFMVCDPILAKVAYERALDMGTRRYFSHTNPDGFGPNYLVEQAGYQLPDWYNQALDANNIESIAAGYTTATAAWNGWLASSGHRAHVLGEISFWANQTSFGIGYAYVPNSPYGHYWVFISAPPQP